MTLHYPLTRWGHDDVYLIEANRHGPGWRRCWRYFLHFPAPVPLRCRTFGHTPGTGRAGAHRWPECRWCGSRPELVVRDGEGHGAYYERVKATPNEPALTELLLRSGAAVWSARQGVLSVECTVGSYKGYELAFKLGGPGSENDWQVHVHLGRLANLFVSGEGVAWAHRLQRSMYQRREKARDAHVAAGGRQHDLDLYGSREIAVGLVNHARGDWSLTWRVWLNRDTSRRDTTKWRYGYVSVNPLDYLLGGPRRYSHEVRAEAPIRLVTNEGTSHDVDLTLQRTDRGRPRGPRRPGWTVSWNCKQGLDVYVGRDWKGNEVMSSGFTLTDDEVDGGWQQNAAAKLRAWATQQRTDSGWLRARAAAGA